MRSFIIHMKGDQKRAPNAEKLKGLLPGAELSDAVVGRDAIADGRHPLRPGNLHKPAYPFPLSAGEVGCFLSHRACWQQIWEGNEDFGLIVEDDLALDPGLWRDALELAVANAGPETFIRLPAKRRESPSEEIGRKGEAVLFRPRRIGLQTVAQLVGRNAARRLLEASAKIDRPVDTFLQMHWIHGQEILTVLPNGVSEITAELGGSTIQKKPEGGKLAREVKRALYRVQVAMRPQRG